MRLTRIIALRVCVMHDNNCVLPTLGVKVKLFALVKYRHMSNWRSVNLLKKIHANTCNKKIENKTNKRMANNYFKRVWGVSRPVFKQQSSKSGAHLLKEFRQSNQKDRSKGMLPKKTSVEGLSKNNFEFLSKWAIQNNISQTALDSLLAGLNKNTHFNLPKSSEQLLKTSRTANSVPMNDGCYCHIGIEKCLIAAFNVISKNHPIPLDFILDFSINVTYAKSTKSSLWLIQMSIQQFEFKPFVIGAYCGKEKPNINDFLKAFVDELARLTSFGFHYNRETIIIRIGNFCCETPAISFLRGSKGHTGFNSCIKCTQKRIRLDSCLVFPYITQADRTDEDFRSRKDPEHHIKTTILESIDSIGMVRAFPIDEMHIVHLGVMKKLVTMWITTLSKTQLEEIDSKIQTAETYHPFKIRRQIRSLNGFKQFKAKEFRGLLMYTVPFILENILEKRKYENFLLLYFAM